MDTLDLNQPDSHKSVSAAFCFPRSLRLLSAKDYKDVFDRNDLRVSHKNVLLLARTNNRAATRLGLVFAKKNVSRSVDRNRLKRITREQFRLKDKSTIGLDLVVMARPALADMDNKTYAALIRKMIGNVQQQAHTKNDLPRA